VLTYLGIVLAARTRTERGASAVEYGLLMAGVCLAVIVGFEGLSLTLRTVFSNTNSDVQAP
jgi:Flp pilus assembly pilin Flp